MKKSLLPVLLLAFAAAAAFGQQKVNAVANLIERQADTISLKKGKSFVVQLPVHNRKGDDWELVTPPSKCNFTAAMLGKAGTMPNEQEPKLMFFKATDKGQETISFRGKTKTGMTEDDAEIRSVTVIIE